MNNARRYALPALLLLSLGLGLLFELVLPAPKGLAASLLREGAVRLCYAGAVCLLGAYAGLALGSLGARPGRLGALCLVLSFAVALNNLPISCLLSGAATVTAGGDAVLALALSCLATALFEELLFRFFLFRLMLDRFGLSRRGRLAAVLLSSAVFGLSHLFNLAAGASPGATLLQVGYSFLVGCLCAALCLLYGRLSLAVAFHAVYNFCGYLVPRLGQGPLYDAPTVAVTVLLALACGGCLLWAVFDRKNKIF